MKKKGYNFTKHGVTVDDHSSHDPKPYTPSKTKVEAAGHEMKENPPAILKHTAKKFGKAKAKKQRVAIMLAKARRGK